MKASRFQSYPPALHRAICNGVARICTELEDLMPLTARQVKSWLVYLARGQSPADYYLQHTDLPMFLFPWFLESGQTKTDITFLNDRVYSTINGFYYIRLLDDITDHHADSEVTLLPALGFFHTQFQQTYQEHFAAGHPFWDYFRQVWFHSADVTIADLGSRKISRREFIRVAAQKTCAVKIPLAAVAHKYGQVDALVGWSRFLDVYGCWHQMANDMFHWHEDLSLETTTYFLSEATRRKRTRETVADWVIREGFEWGINTLDEWMSQAQELAVEIEVPDLWDYLQYRTAKMRRKTRATLGNLRAAAQLGNMLFS
jgi:hypothetical protein